MVSVREQERGREQAEAKHTTLFSLPLLNLSPLFANETPECRSKTLRQASLIKEAGHALLIPCGCKPQQRLCWKLPPRKTSVFCPLLDCPSLLVYWTKTCLKKLHAREQPEHIQWEGCMKWSTGSTENLSFALILLFDPLPQSLFGTVQHQAHKSLHDSLRVILSVPADEKKHYSAIWSRSSRSFISPSRITEKLLTTFPLLVRTVYNYIMQIFYAFLCIFFFILPNLF